MSPSLIRCTLLPLVLAASVMAAASTADAVKAEGRLIIGMGMDAAPFGFRDQGRLVGFDVDIAKAVAARLETYLATPVKTEFKAVSDETRIAWVQSGEVHMSLCHTNITRKREGSIDFSTPYGWDGKGVLYRSADGPRDLKDFAGRTIGIKRSSSSEGEIRAYFRKAGWQEPTITVFDQHAAGIQALADGQIDGFTDDNSIIITVAMRSGRKVGPGGMFAVTDTPYSPAFFGIGLPENDSRWRKTINHCLHDLWRSGEYRKIYDLWFGPASDCPLPLGIHHIEAYVDG